MQLLQRVAQSKIVAFHQTVIAFAGVARPLSQIQTIILQQLHPHASKAQRLPLQVEALRGTLRSYFKLLAYLERYGNERQNGKETDKLRDSGFCSHGDVKYDGNAKYSDYIMRLHAIQR